MPPPAAPAVPKTALPPPPPSSGPTPATSRERRKIQPRQKKRDALRLLIYAVEGWGKTTLGAYAPDPFILMARGETGYDTLHGVGRVPTVPAAEATTWAEANEWVEDLAEDTQGRKVLVLDGLAAFERLCHEHVCETHFNNDWSERGFLSYHKGYEMAVNDWLLWLAKLDRVRAKGVAILLLGHSAIKPFANPMGDDFDRYTCQLHAKTWAATKAWADCVLFGQFYTVVETDKGKSKGKAVGGFDRIVYTEHRDAFEAKNRLGLTPEFCLSGDPAQSWASLMQKFPQTGGTSNA